ncbi:MAG: M20/M25/M40 family metallo-hydrolase [Candidatus Eisenbacteria sp.]|nr:M20/M25/M40 family metallo-hydrolase [Candidatus Eisenbacteria bacterium]
MRKGTTVCALVILVAGLFPGLSGGTRARVPQPVESALTNLRMPGSPRLERAQWAASQVDSGVIRGHLRELSTYPDGTLKTRQYLRDETTDEALAYIEGELNACLTAPGDTVWRQPFTVAWSEGDQVHQKEIYNCIGLHKGSAGGSYYLLCGHYDSIAKRTEGWDWKMDPAPGADDNGTGIACVLETARVLGALTFDFDLRFVAFTGEEYGLLGSKFYVEQAVAGGDTILGVLNIDMVGYDVESRMAPVILANDRSEWIADWLLEMADSLDLEINPAKVPIPGHMVLRSDHGYFQLEGYPAVSCWETVGGDSSEFNPNYHTVEDVVTHVSVAMVTEVGRMFAGSVALLAQPEAVPEFEVPTNGVIVRPNTIRVGDSVSVQAVVRNLGPDTGGPVSFTAVLLEGPAGGPVHEVRTRVINLDLRVGEWEYATISWVPGAGSVGEREVRMRVVPESPDLDTDSGNNEGSRQILVQATEAMAPVVFDVYVYPNPVRDLGNLTFHYQLSRGADVEINVYTLEGQEIASFSAAYDRWAGAQGTVAGSNDVPWNSFDGRPASLAPGLYLYCVEIRDGVSEEPTFGKFAIIR